MVSIPFLLILPGLLQLASAGTVPTRTNSFQTVEAAAKAPPDLLSDFQQNNVSAKWAEGYPKEWGSESFKLEYPLPLGSSTSFFAAVSKDEKILALTNGTHAKVFKMDNMTLVSEFPLKINWAYRILLRSAPEGQHDLFATSYEYNNPDGSAPTRKIRLSPDGIPTGQETDYNGRLSSFDIQSISNDGRRLLTLQSTRVFVYDVDDPSKNLTLNQHSDSVMSAIFSPDGKYIATAAWDGYGKLWNATSGELVYSFGPSGGQNWLTRFSPDGKYVLVAVGSGTKVKPHVKIWSLTNLTAEPIEFAGLFPDWVRSAEWTSDGEYLAIGSYGKMIVYSMNQRQIVQTWQMEDNRTWEIYELVWLEGSKRLAYKITGGLEIYDFEKNLKYRWGPGDLDHYNYGAGIGSLIIVKSKGWIGGADTDMKLRFWPYPA